MQVLLFIYDLSFSCSPVFKDPCLRSAHFRSQSCRRYLPALLDFKSLRLACCRCARLLQRGAVFTASLLVRQAFLFQPVDFLLPTSFRFVSGGRLLHPPLFPVKPLVSLFFRACFSARFRLLFPSHRMARGAASTSAFFGRQAGTSLFFRACVPAHFRLLFRLLRSARVRGVLPVASRVKLLLSFFAPLEKVARRPRFSGPAGEHVGFPPFICA